MPTRGSDGPSRRGQCARRGPRPDWRPRGRPAAPSARPRRPGVRAPASRRSPRGSVRTPRARSEYGPGHRSSSRSSRGRAGPYTRPADPTRRRDPHPTCR